MKKKIFSILLATLVVGGILTGCSTSKKTTTKHAVGKDAAADVKEVVYEDEHIKMTSYKGLPTSTKLDYSITDEDINSQISNDLNNYYSSQNSDTKSTAEPSATASSDTTTASSDAKTSDKEKSYTQKDLTDDIVAKMTSNKYKTVDDYIKNLKKTITKSSQDQIQSTVGSELFQTVVTNTTLKKYEQKDYDKYYKYSEDYYKEYAKYADVDFSDFKKDYLKCDDDKAYKKLLKEEAETNCKTQYIIQAISKEEKVDITDEDIQKQIQEYIDSGNFKDEKAVLDYITKDDIKTNLQYNKVQDIIFDNAVYVPEETTSPSATESTTSTSEPTTDSTTNTPESTEAPASK